MDRRKFFQSLAGAAIAPAVVKESKMDVVEITTHEDTKRRYMKIDLEAVCPVTTGFVVDIQPIGIYGPKSYIKQARCIMST